MFMPLLTRDQVEALPERAREVVEYRKSGLSLNHVQGCPLDCAYCIRHTYGVWDMNQPRALMDDASAVRALVEHPYFQPNVTPIQVFNRATDPMLPRVKNHLFAVLADLDARGLRNHVLVITRYKVTGQDCERFNELRNVKLTLLYTYYRHRRQAHRAVPQPGCRQLAAAGLRPGRALPHDPVLAASGPGAQRHTPAPARRRRAEQGGACDGVHWPVLPGRDRRLLPGQRPT